MVVTPSFSLSCDPGARSSAQPRNPLSKPQRAVSSRPLNCQSGALRVKLRSQLGLWEPPAGMAVASGITLAFLNLLIEHPPPKRSFSSGLVMCPLQGVPTPLTLRLLGKAAQAVIQAESLSMRSLHDCEDISLHCTEYSILPLSSRPPLHCRYLKSAEHAVYLFPLAQAQCLSYSRWLITVLNERIKDLSWQKDADT